MKPLETLAHLSRLPVGGVVPPFEEDFATAMADVLSQMVRMRVYAKSVTVLPGCVAFLGREGVEKRLCALAAASGPRGLFQEVVGRSGEVRAGDEAFGLKVCELTHANAAALRRRAAFTAPALIGTAKSIGLGDRLGLATPGHVAAVAGTGVAPYLAQQSIREMTRTERTPEEVMDGATWGVFQAGWRGGFGSDADHLKTPADVDRTAAAGFTMFTIDPGEHVDGAADTDDAATLGRKFEELPWDRLETTPEECRQTYVLRPMPPGCADEPYRERHLIRAGAKYGRAVAHTVRMYRHVARAMAGRPFEVEVSVDETATPTTEHEHYYVGSELRRLGVRWVGLAPRFVGEFQKGVDYIGDLEEFRRSFARHAAVARHLGPYKISLHSGSDKFSVYPIAAELTGGLVHVKTAGTSYLEALRAIAAIDPGLFREILGFARERYETDKATYHVSADPSKVPAPEDLKDADLPGVLDLFDGRQVLHVTFGSVLTARPACPAGAVGRGEDRSPRFRGRLLAALRRDEDRHYAVVAKHMGRHLAPLADR